MVFVPNDSAKIRQAYCTLAEMDADLGDLGLRPDILTRFILPASQYLQREIGQFIPTLEMRIIAGNSRAELVIPPLLSLITVKNDESLLPASVFILLPATRMWANGPYVRISLDPEVTSGAYWVPEKNAVEISGTWGLWEQVARTGATLTSNQAIDAETLEASDAGKVSPGMTLLIESEVQFVTGFGDPVAAVTALAATLDNQGETLTVASSANIFPGEIIRVDFEQMKVLDKKVGKLNVARGWAGSTKTGHSSSADIDVYKVFAVERSVNGTAAAAHVATTALRRYSVPEDINYLTRQIATLMLKKAQTGYAGRSGNSETGETFYNYEFPKDAIARVKANYYIPHTR